MQTEICTVFWRTGRGGSEIAIWVDPEATIGFTFHHLARDHADVYRCKCKSKKVIIKNDVLYTMSSPQPARKDDLIRDDGQHKIENCNTYVKGEKTLILLKFL